MDIDKEREKIGKFIKAGLFGLSFVLLLTCSILYIPGAVKTFQTSEEEERGPIQCVECSEKKIALSFNISGKNDDIAAILDVLARNHVNGTFFLTGKWVSQYPDDVKSIQAAGHDLGNYSENHKKMTQLSKEECVEEIRLTHNRIRELTGTDMKLFRAPYGEFNETIMEASDELGYYPIQWNVDSKDWKDYGVDSIVNDICNSPELRGGSIIVCHNGTKFTKEALDTVIATLQEKGYTFVKISDMLV